MQRLAWFHAAELACMHHERSDNPARCRHCFSPSRRFPGSADATAGNGWLSRTGRSMTSPAWLAGTLAALMILVAVAAAGRLCWRRLRARRVDADVDALHVLMGIAMAGMFEPSIGFVLAVAWQVAFAVAAAWFAGQMVRQRRGTAGRSRHSHPAAHLVECGAMIYVFWPSAPGRLMASMPAMSGHAGVIAGNPAIALVLAGGMLGYTVWAIDQLLSRVRLTAVPAGADGTGCRGDSVTASARRTDLRQNRAAGSLLAPRLAALQKITMGLAMGYMLLTML
jgi:hypothetical protein